MKTKWQDRKNKRLNKRAQHAHERATEPRRWGFDSTNASKKARDEATRRHEAKMAQEKHETDSK